MTDDKHKAMRAMIWSRIHIAWRLLEKSPGYRTLCKQQAQNKAAISALYLRFSPEERRTVSAYCAGERERVRLRMEVVYAQGASDGKQAADGLSDSRP